MAYEDEAYIKKNLVRAALDDFEYRRMLRRVKAAGYPDVSKYVRSLIRNDINGAEIKEGKVPHQAQG